MGDGESPSHRLLNEEKWIEVSVDRSGRSDDRSIYTYVQCACTEWKMFIHIEIWTISICPCPCYTPLLNRRRRIRKCYTQWEPLTYTLEWVETELQIQHRAHTHTQHIACLKWKRDERKREPLPFWRTLWMNFWPRILQCVLLMLRTLVWVEQRFSKRHHRME